MGMIKAKTKSMISKLRNSGWSKVFVFLMVVNFINLSANFYEGNILISGTVDLNDPVDTLSELIFEWALEGGDDLIPDNGTQQDDNSLEKIKLGITEITGLKLCNPILDLEIPRFTYLERIIHGYFSSSAPPPDLC